MRYNIFTEIDGIKKYVRRFKRNKYHISITMVCSYQGKAFDFQTQERVGEALALLGIGYAIEVN